MNFRTILAIRDAASPALAAKIAQISPNRLNQSVAHSAVRLTKLKLLLLPHNKRGWTPTNFYKRAAASVISTVLPEGVLISIPQIGMRQRYQGGEIKPVNKKFLAIPVAEESYGKVPADFGDQLQLVAIKGKGAWLALRSYESAPSPRGEGRGEGGRSAKRTRNKQQGPGQSTVRERLKFLFRLSAGVTQQANPDILPTDDQYRDEALNAIEEALK
jgi:hypothetical protein